jgi:hypothetical protein
LNLSDEAIKYEVSRGVASGDGHALRHELRAKALGGFEVKVEVCGNRRPVGNPLRGGGKRANEADGEFYKGASNAGSKRLHGGSSAECNPGFDYALFVQARKKELEDFLPTSPIQEIWLHAAGCRDFLMTA